MIEGTFCFRKELWAIDTRGFNNINNIWRLCTHSFCKHGCFKTIPVNCNGIAYKMSVRKDLLSQLDQVYHWGIFQSTQKHYNYLKAYLQDKQAHNINKVIKNAKL